MTLILKDLFTKILYLNHYCDFTYCVLVNKLVFGAYAAHTKPLPNEQALLL